MFYPRCRLHLKDSFKKYNESLIKRFLSWNEFGCVYLATPTGYAAIDSGYLQQKVNGVYYLLLPLLDVSK